MRAFPLLLLLAACPSNPAPPIDARATDAPRVADAAVDAKPDAPADAALAKGGFVSLVIQHETTTSAQADVQFSDGFPLGQVIGTDGPCTISATQRTAHYPGGVITVTGTRRAVTITPSGTAPNVSYTAAPDPLPAMLWN